MDSISRSSRGKGFYICHTGYGGKRGAVLHFRQQRLAGGGNNALALAAHLGHFPIQQLQLLVKSASHGITQTFL